MKKNKLTKRLLVVLFAIGMIVMMFPVAAFAAKKEKRLVSSKTYDAEGKLLSTYSVKLNKNGDIKSYSMKTRPTADSEWSTFSYTSSIKYYKNGNLKKVTRKGSDQTQVITSNKKGQQTKVVTDYKDNDNGNNVHTVTTTTYKKGKPVKQVVKKDGKVTETTLYNKKGLVSKVTEDFGTGTRTTKSKYTYYKNGAVKTKTEDVVSSLLFRTKEYYDKKGTITKRVYVSEMVMDGEKTKGTNTYTFKNTYKGGLLKEQKEYLNGKLNARTVNTYSSKKYPVR